MVYGALKSSTYNHQVNNDNSQPFHCWQDELQIYCNETRGVKQGKLSHMSAIKSIKCLFGKKQRGFVSAALLKQKPSGIYILL